MKSDFFELVQRLCANLARDETLLCSLAGERSDFVRFNHARVRQAGTIEQRYLSMRLVRARRQAYASIALAGGADDFALARATLEQLRGILAHLPEDPWLLISEEPNSTDVERRGRIPQPEDVVQQATTLARDVDFVGFYAGGTIARGFANSLGQRNWHEIDSFVFDWSLHLHADKAVKNSYAGLEWNAGIFEAKLREDAERLGALATPAMTLPPGEYRAFLAPRALEEIVYLLALEGFSARARATRQSPLLKMEHDERLSQKVTLAENTEDGIAPAFQQEGYTRPPRVTLIAGGTLAESLVSPRSAREYGLTTNGANAGERPESIDLAPGDLATVDALDALGTGLYIGNLWYLNFSDRPAGRITGMTRFATFWVEGGRIVAPVNVLRFDDTLYRMLGDNLLALTRERELLVSTSTYYERSTASTRLPGALLSSLRFTL
ncbi:MAG TPA: metallopeptidase TldD-related protein [Burkholderiales bacterium]|nr:metallopeptidase TldD-related protein [Burkholderiales bacterium]